MSEFVVVDASVAIKWFVKEEDSDNATALARYWADEGTRLAAPFLMPFEVANALHRRVARGELEVGGAADLMQDLMSIGIEFYESSGLYGRALELASLLGQGAVYDAHYLALAQIFDCEYWTADQRFYRAATQADQNVRWIGEFVAPV